MLKFTPGIQAFFAGRRTSVRIPICKKGENGMKKFETPTMDIEELKIIDVITTSEDEPCEYDCPTDAGAWSLRKFL